MVEDMNIARHYRVDKIEILRIIHTCVIETSEHYRVKLTFDLRRGPESARRDGVFIIPIADLVEGLNVTDSHNNSLPILTRNELKSMVGFDVSELERINKGTSNKDTVDMTMYLARNNRILHDSLKRFPTGHKAAILEKIKQEYDNPHYIAVQLPASNSPRYRIFVEYIRPITTFKRSRHRLHAKAVLHEITNIPALTIRYKGYDASESRPTILVTYELAKEYEFVHHKRSLEPSPAKENKSQVTRPNAKIFYYGNKIRIAILHEVEYQLPRHVHVSSLSLSVFSLFLTLTSLLPTILDCTITSRTDLIGTNFPILGLAIVIAIGNKLLVTKDRPLVKGSTYLQYIALLAAGVVLLYLVVLPVFSTQLMCPRVLASPLAAGL